MTVMQHNPSPRYSVSTESICLSATDGTDWPNVTADCAAIRRSVIKRREVIFFI